MGQGSSQLDNEALTAPDALEAATMSGTSAQEDDVAASSQLAAEESRSNHRSKNKDKKKKSSKRISDSSIWDEPSNPFTNGRAKNVQTPKNGTAESESKVTSALRAAAAEAKEERRKQKQAAKAAQEEEPAEIEEDKPSKKRKRKSKDVADVDAKTETESAVADNAQTLGRPENDETSVKKLKNCKRLSKSGPLPTPVKETPIPLPTAPPKSPELAKVQSPGKSKKKARGVEANEQPDKQRDASPGANEAKVNGVDDSAVKKLKKHKKDRKEKKEKKSRHSDTQSQVPGAQEIPPAAIANTAPPMASNRLPAADDLMIDPALLPQTGAQEEQPVVAPSEEQTASKKSKKSKASRRTEKAKAQEDEETEPKPAKSTASERPTNSLFDRSDAHERTGQVAYIEHQKKKEKRKRQSEQAEHAATNGSQVEQTQESRPKKRKTKANGTADAEGELNSKGEKKGTFGDSDDFPSSGPYTKKEIETLGKAIESYRDFSDLTQRQVNDIVQAGVFAEVHGKSCKGFWDEICPCLPNRWSRETIIKFVRRKWHNYEKRGKWDPEEDETLREAYARYPGQWTNIGSELGRFPDDCRDRWRNYLSCSETMSTKRWHDSEVNELLNIVQDCLNTLLERLPEDQQQRWREELQCTEPRKIWMPKEIQNLVRKMPICMDALRAAFSTKHPRNSGQKRATDRRRGSSDTDSSVVINWDLVSEKMGKKRSRLQIMSKWKALENMYTGELKDSFFTEANHWRVENGQKWAEHMLPGDKYNIIKAMQDLGLTNEERIVWNSVAYHDLVKLRWAHQAKMTFLIMKGLVPKQDSLPKTLDALKRYFEKHHKDDLDKHWESKPSRRTSKGATLSRDASETAAATNGNGNGNGATELKVRGGAKYPKPTKSAAYISNEDDEDDGAK
ncbi:hypothetical protein IWZ01DRAFT_510750 [Phyllosticta capitalensis]